MRDTYSAPYRDSLNGLIELIQTIGIPPREGIHGQTGYGLKPLMTVDSFIQAGFHIERCEEIEDFTFPIGLSTEISKRSAYYEKLSKKVFSIKQTNHQHQPDADHPSSSERNISLSYDWGVSHQ